MLRALLSLSIQRGPLLSSRTKVITKHNRTCSAPNAYSIPTNSSYYYHPFHRYQNQYLISIDELLLTRNEWEEREDISGGCDTKGVIYKVCRCRKHRKPGQSLLQPPLETFHPSSFMLRILKARFPVLSAAGRKPRTREALNITILSPLSF